MAKTIGCLHAHHSNIGHIDQALSGLRGELVHFVDPGLIRRTTRDSSFSASDARRRVKEQVEWIGGNGVDAILVTCTQYIATMQDEPLTVSVPVVSIDEPFFDSVCSYEGRQLLLFTNPGTVEGTIRRLKAYARAAGRNPNVEVLLLEGLFELVMQGEQERHDRELFSRIRELLDSEPGVRLSVAQLSMTAAADRAGSELGVPVGHPLGCLVSHMEKTLRML